MHRRPTLATLVSMLLLASAAGGELTPEERRGKQIYLRGTSAAGGEITALMGDDAIEVPAAALPCASCHGPDGQGRPEGGITPSNLTWEALTKPYGVRHEGGREHPPYTPQLLKKAIALGFDPAGNRLNTAMPRYRLTLADMADLVAYVRKLGHDRDPGVDERRLRLATVVPASAADGLGDAVAALLAAWAADVNAGGGLYGRTLELVVRRPDAAAPTPQAALAALLAEEAVFALVAPVVAGAETEMAALAAAHEIPVVGPFALRPVVGFPLNRQVFYLYSGLAVQGRALVDFAARRAPEPPPAVLVHPGDPASAEAAEAMAEQAAAAGWPSFERRVSASAGFDAASLAAELAERGVEVVFFLGSGDDGLAFLGAAAARGRTPEVFAAGPQLGRQAFDAPPAFDGRIFLAFPTLPADASPRGVAAYRRLASEHALPEAHFAAQISALAAAELLAEGLKRAGRDLSREKLVTELEGLYDHDTGLTPRLTYGPNRRVGALGAYVVQVDLAGGALRPVSRWIEVR